ncbi:MAG: succinylglutamate desuccinylase/aspartoacylase family protein [Patescibacteria group bacterium]|nr:succinylglutamate desuccinylase/aspartoacylase family protein [Pseudomonadota bacterium]MBU2415694.1 succinylglutamate desuccinylase/aspartoacylase family protein [Patescibacteria group bacterium]
MKIILNILTHGDERIGLKVAKEIRKLNIDRNILTVQIANSKAFKFRKRFIDQDLNRSFPGKKTGNYEERLAYKLSAAIKSADFVLDIHSTKSELKDAIIVTNLNDETLKYVKAIQPKYVLIMNATKNNALISQAKIGIAFEYGKDNNPDALKKIVADVKKLFSHIGLINVKLHRQRQVTNYFSVVSEVKKPKGYKLLKKIKNYKLIRKDEVFATNGKNYLVAEDSFYPILFGENNYKTIFGFRGKRMS